MRDQSRAVKRAFLGAYEEGNDVRAWRIVLANIDLFPRVKDPEHVELAKVYEATKAELGETRPALGGAE